MRKLLVVLILSTIVLNLSAGCSMFIDGRIKRSESIDYAIVKTAIGEIDAGAKPKDSAYDVLKSIEPNMKNRLDYFYSNPPEVKNGE